MRKRLFLYTMLILMAGLLLYFAASLYLTYANNLRFARDAVEETACLAADLFAQNPASFVEAGDNTRLTVIASDGSVLADSRPLDTESLANHLSRPEIIAAAGGASEAFVRYSETLGSDMVYYAVKVNTGSDYVFIRAALPVEEISAYLFQSLPALLLLLLLIALLCFFFANNMIRRVTLPFEHIAHRLRLLADGTEESRAASEDAGGFEEIAIITRSIDEVSDILQGSFNALRNEKTKLDYILNHIGDGLFVVDENKNIVMINAAALRIFNAAPAISEKSLHYLSYDQGIAAAVTDCVNTGKSALLDILIRGHIYSLTVRKLPDTALTMAALTDVTESRENAKRREEFFANASHELKTPLTAIRGFNELTALHNTNPDISKYIDSIARETDRMMTLIEDMLKLSELENTAGINPREVSLSLTAKEILETLSSDIAKKNLTAELLGEAAVYAEQSHVYELIKNLLENAVRYTDANGAIKISITKTAESTALSVSDNGIGISPEDQPRIFERFYRGEKSRSGGGGGTGLGLAIVKHICVLYNWNLDLKSSPGAGTEVTVIF